MIRDFIAVLARLATGVRRLDEVPHRGGPVIYFANHTSHMDFLVVWAALPDEIRDRTSPVAAEDYWTATSLRHSIASQLFRAVLIPRDNITRKNHPLDRIGVALAEGRSVILFPEGTRAESGATAEFRSGLYHLARKHPDIPLVPVHLENLNRILPKGTHLPLPLIARARFLAPMRLQTEESKPAFLARARAALCEEEA